jgi:ABC-2 type transport system permease protein
LKKTRATVIKEWILFRRDIAGLLLLFIMPAILIVVMALVQDAPFRDYQEMRFDLLMADNDHGSLAQQIKAGLRQSKNFHLVDSIDGKPLTDADLKLLLQKGKYKVGIVIPRGATAEVANSANIVANDLSKKLGLGSTLPAREHRGNTYVHMYFDPVSKPTFRTSIHFALDKFITAACSNELIGRVSRLSKLQNDSTAKSNDEDFAKVFEGVGLKEEPLNDKASYTKHMNSVQHNVPAWAIFGIFFIVIPIGGHIIREREEGSALRIELIPRAHISVAFGKIVFYTLVCTLQFIVMCCIGVWVMPLIHLPALGLGAHPMALLPMALATGFAATSYGYFVGTLFKTTNQALPFGAISVVIFSAMGGIWVPIELLSSAMQKVALLSPMHWALDGVHNLILRDGNFNDILQNIVFLLCFGVCLWLVSIYKYNKRGHSIQ